MLHAISGEHFDAAVIEQHGNVDRHFSRRRAQHLLHTVVEPQQSGGRVESRFRREQRIEFQVVKIRLDRGALNNHVVDLRIQLWLKAAPRGAMGV